MAIVTVDMDFSRQFSDLLSAEPQTWLVTGSAGFIGSHLVETLLVLGQHVVSLDDFSTGHRSNLAEVRERVGESAWRRHEFVEGSVVDLETCRLACKRARIVLHQAALGSVPRSIEDPLGAHAANATGFLNMLVAARDAGVGRFVYAASSSVYGDDPGLPKIENVVGRPLSPYAVTKSSNELYADAFARCYGMEIIGLRYFNVFGERQDPEGAYAAVIPCWVREMLKGETVYINGDGETTRDFCYVRNAVQANLLAALTRNEASVNQVYNIAVGKRTSLNELFFALRDLLGTHFASVRSMAPVHREPRTGDVRHSLADITKAQKLLGYQPTHDVLAGLKAAIPWYIRRFSAETGNLRSKPVYSGNAK